MYIFVFQVYYASEEYGLDNIVTCGGYFLMANVFIKQEKMDIAHSLYTEVQLKQAFKMKAKIISYFN